MDKKIKGLHVILFLSIFSFILMVFLTIVNSYISKRKNTTSAKAKASTAIALSRKSQFDSTLLAKYMTTEAVLLGSIDHVSYYFSDLNTNSTLSIDPERSWIPASTIKAFVVLEAFRQRRLGLIDFNQTVTVSGNNVVPTALESDDFPRLREGTQATIQQLVEAMIVQSDNTAFNVLLDVLDRRNINSTLKSYNLTETVVGEKLSLDDDQEAIDVTIPGRQPNTTTAKDLATFYNLLFIKKVPDADEIVSIFKRQKFKDMIPALIPPDVSVAHKTGEWDPYYHDGGIVYKPNDPFIFTAFSNSGNPQIIAKIARVAYFQSADTVGKPLAEAPVHYTATNRPVYYLSQIPSEKEVLAASTSANSEKFPKISAEDLGVTSSDFGVNAAFSQIVKSATVLPNSPLFSLKQLAENTKLLLAKNADEKAQAYLDVAHDRISEAKALLSLKDYSGAYNVLNQSEYYLKAAADIGGSNKDITALEIKQLSDLRFSLLSETVDKVNPSQKSQFIDATYDLYKKYTTDLAPHLTAVTVTNPTQQKPIVGTVTEVKNNVATIKLDDGTTKKASLLDTTPMRDFQNHSIQSASQLTAGAQISVVGGVSTDSIIAPQFILNNVPKELPKAHAGKVIEIDPNTNKLTILNSQGKPEVITVDQKTLLKSKDTNVSLEGIKAGSQVAIFAVSTPNQNVSPTLTPILSISPAQITPTHSLTTTPQPALTGQGLLNQISPSPQISITPSGKLFLTPNPFITSGTTPKKITPPPSTNKPPTQTQVIKAVSVTVVTNGTGSKEVKKQKIEPPKIEPTKKK